MNEVLYMYKAVIIQVTKNFYNSNAYIKNSQLPSET